MVSKRRRGALSETRVRRGDRAVRGKELVEKLGRNDLCPCGSNRRFQAVLPARRPLSRGPSASTTGGTIGVVVESGQVCCTRFRAASRSVVAWRTQAVASAAEMSRVS